MGRCGATPRWCGVATGRRPKAGCSSPVLWRGTTKKGRSLRKEWCRYEICVVSLLLGDTSLDCELWFSTGCTSNNLDTFTGLGDRTISRMKLNCDVA